jgi:hypothetical protein
VVDPYLCATGHVHGSSLCARCKDGYGMKKSECAECTTKGAPVAIICLLVVIIWFPFLRDIATKRVKSL